MLPYYVFDDLHYGAGVLGLLYMAATSATAGFALLFGFLTDLWGRKGTLLLAGVLLPPGALLVLASTKLLVLFADAMLGGFSATGSRAAAGSVGGAAQPIYAYAVLTGLSLSLYFRLFGADPRLSPE